MNDENGTGLGECVLVVDDDPLVRRVACLTLQRAGLTVSVAATCREALALAASHRFDVAILDYFLGARECGCDLVGPLRAMHRSIRVIVVSGLGALADVVQHAHAAGADVVASKTHLDWLALVRSRAPTPPAPASADVNLAAFNRELIYGAYLVHGRNITRTARALGITRSSLQRRLRKTPFADEDAQGDEDE